MHPACPRLVPSPVLWGRASALGVLRDVARALLSCLPPGALPPFTLACCLLLSLAFPQVPVEMVQFTDLVFGKLLGEGSGEQEVGGRRRAH